LKFYSVHSQIIVILIQTEKWGENNQLSWIQIEAPVTNVRNISYLMMRKKMERLEKKI